MVVLGKAVSGVLTSNLRRGYVTSSPYAEFHWLERIQKDNSQTTHGNSSTTEEPIRSTTPATRKQQRARSTSNPLADETTSKISRAEQEQLKNRSDDIRQLMRLVAHPVAIVTSTNASGDKRVDQRYRGATVSSFNTVTFTPEPIVSFNIKRQSATFEAIQSSGQFNVHLVACNTQTKNLADRFASGNDAKPFHTSTGELEWFVEQSSEEMNESGILVQHSPPAFVSQLGDEKNQSLTKFRLRCSHMVEKTVTIGDHVVVFGRVMHVSYRRNLLHHIQRGVSASCMLYLNRRYEVFDAKRPPPSS